VELFHLYIYFLLILIFQLVLSPAYSKLHRISMVSQIKLGATVGGRWDLTAQVPMLM
jgi:hypothetical protein